MFCLLVWWWQDILNLLKVGKYKTQFFLLEFFKKWFLLSQSWNPKTQLTLSNQMAPAHLVGLEAEKSGFRWFFDGSSSLLKSVSNTSTVVNSVLKIWLKILGDFSTKICYFIRKNIVRNGPLVFRTVLCLNLC